MCGKTDKKLEQPCNLFMVVNIQDVFETISRCTINVIFLESGLDGWNMSRVILFSFCIFVSNVQCRASHHV